MTYERRSWNPEDPDAFDLSKFLTWREESLNGSPGAALNMARVYLRNNDLRSRERRVWEWFEEASALGNFGATKGMGDWLRKLGRGVEAIEYYEQAIVGFWRAYLDESCDILWWGDADFDWYGFEADVRLTIGDIYFDGLGDQERDLKKALANYEEAAEGGSRKAAVKLADIYLNGDAETANFAKAFERLNLALELGDAGAGWTLYRLNRDGRDGGRGDSDAFFYLERAAELGASEAAFELYRVFSEGRKVERDFPRALAALENASERGLGEAAFELYRLYSEGGDVERDFSRALAALENASERGLGEAAFELYRLYSEGDDVERDFSRALAALERASDLGVGKAAFELYRFYLEGVEVERDWGRALAALARAAELGDDEALAAIERLERR